MENIDSNIPKRDQDSGSYSVPSKRLRDIFGGEVLVFCFVGSKLFGVGIG